VLHQRDELNHGGGSFAGAPPYMGEFPFLSRPPPNWRDAGSNRNSITSQLGHLSAWHPAW
jgi:hypothetical protein